MDHVLESFLKLAASNMEDPMTTYTSIVRNNVNINNNSNLAIEGVVGSGNGCIDERTRTETAKQRNNYTYFFYKKSRSGAGGQFLQCLGHFDIKSFACVS